MAIKKEIIIDINTDEANQKLKEVDKNVRVANFAGAGYVDTSKYLVGQEPIDLEIIFYYDRLLTNTTRTLFRSSGANGKGIIVLIATNNALQITTYNTSSSTITAFAFAAFARWVKLNITWSGISGEPLSWISSDYITGRIDFNSSTVSTIGWIGNSTEVIKIGNSVGTFNSYIYQAKLNNYFYYIFNHGQGTIIYDISGRCIICCYL